MCNRCENRRYVVALEILGTFLHAKMQDIMQMLSEGTIAEMFAKIDLIIYRKHIWYYKQGKPILYLKWHMDDLKILHVSKK